MCWGANDSGQLGPAVASSRSATPVTVPGIAPLALAAGDRHTCARTSAGIICWGANDSKQLGDAATVHGPGAPIPGSAAASSMAAGSSHTCAAWSGSVFCWGAGAQGQQGNDVAAATYAPVQVNAASGASAVGAGTNHVWAASATCTLQPPSPVVAPTAAR